MADDYDLRMLNEFKPKLSAEMRSDLIWCREELEDIADGMLAECGEGPVRYSLVKILRRLYERMGHWTHECDQVVRCVEQALSTSKEDRIVRLTKHALSNARRALEATTEVA